MKVTVRINFIVNSDRSREIEDLFVSYGIQIVTPKKGKSSELSYNVPITGEDGLDLYSLVSTIINSLKNKFNVSHVGEFFFYECNDIEYEEAPYFLIKSTGNSNKSNIDDTGNALEYTTYCPECRLQKKTLTQNLIIDTSVLQKKHMINVGSQFWVVSERMAELMHQWNLKGYSLKEVSHKSKKNEAVPAYQLIPTNVMPPWSKKMIHYYFTSEEEESCSYCGVRGRIDYPYHYDLNQLSQIDVDIVKSKEFTSNGSYAYQTLLISKRFRNLLLEHKITRDVRSSFSENYGPNDWLLFPVITC